MPETAGPVRVALYTRVSTEDQAKEGFSLDAQLDRLESYAKAQGWRVAGRYVDEGHSGRTAKRPMYQRMMEERAQWDTLLVLKMDRIHRNSRNFMAMMDELRREGKEFASVTESLDTSTAMGRFVMDIIQRIAQLESDQIGERTYVGMEQKAKSRAGNLGKPAPFGYRYGPDRRLEHVEAEVPIVRKLFASFLSGAKRGDIAQEMNSNGLRTRAGKPWTRWNVGAILANPTYAGGTMWDKVVAWDTHPAAVGRAQFLAAQEIIRKDSPSKAESRTLLVTNNSPPAAN